MTFIPARYLSVQSESSMGGSFDKPEPTPIRILWYSNDFCHNHYIRVTLPWQIQLFTQSRSGLIACANYGTRPSKIRVIAPENERDLVFGCIQLYSNDWKISDSI